MGAERQFPVEERSGKLLPVVSSGNVAGTLAINQDATVVLYRRLAAGQSAIHGKLRRKDIPTCFSSAAKAKVNGRPPLRREIRPRLTDDKRSWEIAAESDAEIDSAGCAVSR